MMKKNYPESRLGRNTIRKAVYNDYKVVRIQTETNGWGAIKTLIVVGLLALQLSVIVLIYVFLSYLLKWYMAFSYALCLVTCVYVLSTNKNSLSKAVWILFILLSFGFGYIIYFLSDERIFFGRSKRRYAAIFSRAEKFKDISSPVDRPETACDVSYLQNTGGFVAYNDAKLKYFPSGATFFDDVLNTLRGAQKFIFMEMYIISDGVLLDRVYDVLSEKAAEGVDVRIIFDFIGCHKTLGAASKKKLKKAGVKLQEFNRLTPRFSVALNIRDHRKFIIVDGRTAYTGGVNLADEYINEKRMFGYWKDSGIKVEGRAVNAFTLFYLRQWDFVTRTEEEYAPYMNASDCHSGESLVIPYVDGLEFDYRIGKNVYENMITGARRCVFIMTPYFIPDDSFVQLLVNKALSGVDVSLVIPGIPDKSFVYSVTRNFAEKLLDSGVKVYCMKNSFVHSKVMLTENCAVVGSINCDLRSFYQQFESAVYTDDKVVMDDIERDFEYTISNSEQITDQNRMRKNLLHRIYAGLLHLVAPFM